MLFRILLIAAAALLHSAPTSRADVATINDAAALEELLVPFNDLLPPLLESDGEQSTAITTTTTAATARITKRSTTPIAAIKTTPLTTTTTTSTPTTTKTTATQFSKPTKKSYYQQQTQQINNKDLHKVDEKVGVPAKSQDIQLLTLDLLPPFESVADETSQQPQQQQQEQQEQQSSNQQSVKLALPKTTKVSAVTQSKTLKQNVPKQQATKQHVANKPTPQQQPTASVFRQQQNVDSITTELQQQYADYFNKQTTRRPPRGPLPTITPFPNRIK